MNNSKLNLEFNFTLLTFFSINWFVILRKIISMTYQDPSIYELSYICFIHFIIFIYIVLLIISLYATGLLSMNANISSKLKNIYGLIMPFIYSTWIYALIFILIIYIFSSFQIGSQPQDIIFNSVFSIGLIILIIDFIRTQKKNSYIILRRVVKILGITTSIIIGFLIYLLLMSQIFSNIKVETDKQFYTYDDDIIVSMRSSGYFLLPEIKHASYGNYQRSITKNFNTNVITVKIPINEIYERNIKDDDRVFNTFRADHYLKIFYKTPTIPILKEKIEYFRVADYVDPSE